MIKVYKSKSDAQYNRVTKWLDSFYLPYKVISQTGLLYDDLKQILYLTDEGFEDILVSKAKAPQVYKKVPENILEMNVDELIKFILTYQKLLKTPLVFDDNNLLVGYNSEQIRIFVPRIRDNGRLLDRSNVLIEC